MAGKSALPVYEVEFIPLERRLDDRRRHASSAYSGPERRHQKSRRCNSTTTSLFNSRQDTSNKLTII